MKQISILFTKHKGFNLFSSAIMWGTSAPFSHVAVQMTDSDTGQTVIYQASGLAVNCVCQEELLNVEDIVYQKDFQINDQAFIAGKSFLIAQLGKQYNISAIFGFAYQILMLKLFNKSVPNPARADGSEWVCSWLIAQFINVADKDTLNVNEMTPIKLYEAVPNLPNNW